MNKTKQNKGIWIGIFVLLVLFLVVMCHSCVPELAVSVDESVYDLCGRKVLEVGLPCGVYIKNGKKVIIK